MFYYGDHARMRAPAFKEGLVKRKKVYNNTYRYDYEDGTIVWRLHNTDVVTKLPDGRYVLNSGGWRTVTTKERINRYAPVRVWSHKGEWYVYENGEWREPFYDGIIVGSAYAKEMTVDKIDNNGLPVDDVPTNDDPGGPIE